MKITSTILSVSLIISSAVTAQSFSQYSDFSIILKADSNSRSVLLSNLLETKPGNQSPIIGTAAWTDLGRNLQCRSLLSFDYGMLPKVIDAERISKAELILVPLQINSTIDNSDKQYSKFMVQRVGEKWEDSLATWSNQPLADSKGEVTKQINPKKKDKLIRVNVTEMVKNMFLLGNNGFLIKYGDSLSSAASFSHWFASAKIEDEDLRPLLVITFEYHLAPNTFANESMRPLPVTDSDRNKLMQNYVSPQPVIVAPPEVVTPSVKNKQ